MMRDHELFQRMSARVQRFERIREDLGLHAMVDRLNDVCATYDSHTANLSLHEFQDIRTALEILCKI